MEHTICQTNVINLQCKLNKDIIIVMTWTLILMKQVEDFKANQRAEFALHSAFHMITGDPVYRDDEYGHLQVC